MGIATPEHIRLDGIDFTDDFELREEAVKELDRRLAANPNDTRSSLKGFVPNADPYQLEVIEASDRTIRLIAPAGSGKTQTAIQRVLARVRAGVRPERILVLTFDNAAVQSLRSSLETRLSELRVELPPVPISTLNAYGYGLLRDHAPHERKDIVTPQRARRMVRDMRDELKQRAPERFESLPGILKDIFYLDFFSLLKNELFDPRASAAQALADFMLTRRQAEPFFDPGGEVSQKKLVIQAVIWMFQRYEQMLQRDRVMDFDDQKLRAFAVLNEHGSLLSRLQAGLDEVIVDEFQDINRLDFSLIDAFARKAVLVVCGDDDQAIYGFRGSTAEFIIDLAEHTGREVTSYELRTNYRCPPNIVEHADRLIRFNSRRIEKHPIAASKIPSKVRVVSSLSSGIESKWVVNLIKREVRRSKGLEYRDFVVLFRTNAQSLPLQIEFILNDVPYHVRDEDNILLNDELKKLLGALRAKRDLNGGGTPAPRDQMYTVRAYFRFVSPERVDQLVRLFSEGADFLDTITSRRFHAILPQAERSHFEGSVREMIDSASLIETLDLLSKRFKGLQAMIGSLEDVAEDKVPLGEIYEVALNFGGDLDDFVATIERALERAAKSQAGRDQGGVGLRTFFRSKGLQWHTVILPSCNDGLIPHRRAPLEDERRLFYVAMTRASANLVISYVQNVCNNKVAPSRFLSEAGLI